MHICSFLWSYYGFPTSTYEGVNVEAMRYRNGGIMAENDEKNGNLPKVDFVAGVPDSRGFYYLYYLNDNDYGPQDGAFNTSDDCPYAGHIDFSTYDTTYNPGQNCADDLGGVDTLNDSPIGRYIAGWGRGRDDSPYLWDSENQNTYGWHRLGFRYHQEVASVSGSTVTYAGYTELYIDGILVWRVHTNMSSSHKDSLYVRIR